MGEMIRPLVLFAVGFVALKMAVFYFLSRWSAVSSQLDFAGVLFVLAAYAGCLVLATTRPVARATAPAIGRAIARMNWPEVGQWEWAIGEVAVLIFLFRELYRLRRIQRRDREKANARRRGPNAAGLDQGRIDLFVSVAS